MSQHIEDRGISLIIQLQRCHSIVYPFSCYYFNGKGIRVNAVAPGPIYSPLIPATFDEEKVEHQGDETPMGRRGQPAELAPSYVFLATHADSSYITGQVIHVNGGDFITS